MDLILWRHAEAVDSTPDHQRELTAKGHKQAFRTAAFLKQHLPEAHRVLVSPAARAQQTAAALSSPITLAPTISPGASPDAVLKAARWPDEGGTVIIVCHQPTLGEVAAKLLGSNQSYLSIKKGALWWFTLREGSSAATLKLVIAPDCL